MPKNTDIVTTDEQYDPLALVGDDLAVFDDTTTPIDAGALLERVGLNAPRIKAGELLEHGFVIGYCRKFDSDMNKRGYAYFCVIKLDGSDELNTTVLGANTVVDFLDLCTLKAPGHPIHMTISRVDGGKYGKYYVIR